MSAQTLSLPPHGVLDPATAPPLRWGVISPGSIAEQFTATMHRATASRVVAVASRSQDRADAFAAKHGIEAAFAGPEAMLAAGGLDAVYIASPHAQHHELARPVLEAGVPVLVEKAFTLNESQARDLLDLAQQRGVFAMEAMWARFLPQYGLLRAVISEGLIGEVVQVEADHGQAFPEDPAHRLYAPELGGGALLDLGVYPLSLAQMLLGDLQEPAIRGELTATGVDAFAGVVARGERGGWAVVSTTLRAHTANRAVIAGTRGRVVLPSPFYAPGNVDVVLDDGRTASWSHPGDVDDGMAFEIAEAARCITAGESQSTLMTWKDTLSVMRTMDAVRSALGVTYPGEAH